MLRSRHTKEKSLSRRMELLVVAAVIVAVFACGCVYANSSTQKVFPSPEDAVKAMVDAAKSSDTKLLLTIMGPGSKHVILSGDPVEDKRGREWFVKHYEEKNRLGKENPDKVTLYAGNDDWPFPIPIVKSGKGWIFDTKAGKAEILARRVGKNELNAVQVCLAYVDAQKEYAMRKGRQGQGLLEYAQRFVGKPGTQDGLFWEAAKGEEQSPMGPLFAAAREEGYGEKPLGGRAMPYHGYLYRILKAQGANAPGGAHDYVVGDNMIGGFALVAYPARYRSSGVMTFIVNQDGVVFQKDLGRETRKTAHAVKVFDPDKTWARVPESTGSQAN